MEKPREYLQIRHESIVQENIDDEYIVINLETGTYYSFRDSAVPIWQLLANSLSIEDIVRELQEVYEEGSENIHEHCHSFINYLKNENLIERLESADNSRTNATKLETRKLGIFIAPLVESYSDVQDLLLLDPIHDVTESGWPHLPAETETTS